MKKLIIVAVVLAMALSLAACGAKTAPVLDSAAPEGGSSANPAAAPTPDENGLVIFDVKGAVTLKSLTLDKAQYTSADPITVTVTADGIDENCTAWVGIVPSDVPHGSEDENDKFDIDYYYLASLENGVANFSVTLSAGNYDIRVFDSDDAGIELGYISFVCVG